jgi:hypothetical protein
MLLSTLTNKPNKYFLRYLNNVLIIDKLSLLRYILFSKKCKMIINNHRNFGKDLLRFSLKLFYLLSIFKNYLSFVMKFDIYRWLINNVVRILCIRHLSWLRSEVFDNVCIKWVPFHIYKQYNDSNFLLSIHYQYIAQRKA